MKRRRSRSAPTRTRRCIGQRRRIPSSRQNSDTEVSRCAIAAWASRTWAFDSANVPPPLRPRGLEPSQGAFADQLGAVRTRAEPIRMCRKRSFATYGQRRRPARSAVCRISCRILCLVYVERACQCRAPMAWRADEAAMGRSRCARGRQGLPAFEGVCRHAQIRRRAACTISVSVSVSQWSTSRRISTEPPPNFNSGLDIPAGGGLTRNLTDLRSWLLTCRSSPAGNSYGSQLTGWP